MESLATGISNLLAALDPDEAKLLRIAQNNTRYKNSVVSTWSDDPNVADFLLSHTNGLYFKEDTAPRKGAAKDKGWYLLGVYIDDSMARSEINARRELLRLAMAQEGLHVDEIVIHPARAGMKEHHLFPESVERIAQLLGCAQADSPSGKRAPKADARHARADQSILLETVKRAFCRSFENLDQAGSILEKIEGAALVETRFSRRAASGTPYYRLHLYASDREKMQAVIDVYGDTVISCAKPLGLMIQGIAVHESNETLRGACAFPKTGQPVALEDLNLHELRTESPQIAEDVRRKVRTGG